MFSKIKSSSYIKFTLGSFFPLLVIFLIVNPAHCQEQYRGTFVSDTEKDTAFDKPASADFGNDQSGGNFLSFGNPAASIIYYYKTNGDVYKVTKCGYRCNPLFTPVRELSAIGKCVVRKLPENKYDLHCTAITSDGEKYTNTLTNARKE